MSITHLKKQAKNLVRLLPAHISAHPTGGSLSACQELIARSSGFPSFHAATTRKETHQTDAPPLSVRIFDDLQDVYRRNAADLDMWNNRTHGLISTVLDLQLFPEARGLISAVLDLQLFLEARGETLHGEALYDFFALEAACIKWRACPGQGTFTLEQYLYNLPAYVIPPKLGHTPVREETTRHHDFIAMSIKSLRGNFTWSNPASKNLGVVCGVGDDVIQNNW